MLQRTFLVLLILLFCPFVYGQANFVTAPNTYQTNANGLYWKWKKPHEAYWQQDVHYVIDVYFDDEKEVIQGKEELTYWNNSPDTLFKLYMHLYQNAFTPNSFAHELRKQGGVQTVFGAYEKAGLGTTIESVSVNGKRTNFSIDNTILIIELETPLAPGRKLKLNTGFSTYFDKGDEGNIRRRMKSFYHNGVKHFNAVHWYPRMCVYDRKFGWTTDQHLGKEFYGDFGTWDVRLNLPTQYVLEATGSLVNREEAMPEDLREKLDISNFQKPSGTITQPIPADGSRREWIFHAENVHDFAWTADPTYRIGEVVWNGISCIALVQEPNAHRWQQTAQFVAEVVEIYSKDFGMYAYPKIVAADARDGMEYPMITLNSGNWPGHQYVISHEVGHNWFFGMIGNNETYRASLDEGFAQFLTSWSLKKVNANSDGLTIEDGVVFNRYFQHVSTANTARLNTHSDHFYSAERHGGGYSQVYFKTAAMLYNLREILGEQLFLEAMQHYVGQWKICHPYWEDFRQSIIDYTRVDLNGFFDSWIEKNQTIDYAVRSVRTKRDTTVIQLKRNGEISMPLTVSVTDENGADHYYYIPNGYFVKKTDATVLPKWVTWDALYPTYEFRVPFKAKQVEIDPGGRIADVNRLNNKRRAEVHFKFNKFRAIRGSHRRYEAGWHPELWYNHVDGIKVGAAFSGNYFNYHHRVDVAVFYNTGIGLYEPLKDKVDQRYLVNYRLDYQNRFNQNEWWGVNSAFMAGAHRHEIYYRHRGKNTIQVSAKTIGRPENSLRDYALRPAEWIVGRWNTSLNLNWSHPYAYQKGNGEIKVDIRSAALFSDYKYGWLKVESINKNKLGKLEVNTRLFAGIIGSRGINQVAPESVLLLDGANSEEMWENPIIRSQGFIQETFAAYGASTGHFHAAGGLNVRGSANYWPVSEVEDNQFRAISAGEMGASANVELEFISVLNGLRKFNRRSPIDLEPYAFADGGILFANLDNLSYNSGFRGDLGLGLRWEVATRWTQFERFTIRTDFPVVMNRVPADQNYAEFRYVIGFGKVIQ